MPTSRRGKDNHRKSPETMTAIAPTPNVTGATPLAAAPPLTSDDAAQYDDRLLPLAFNWATVAIGLALVWVAAVAAVWVLAPIALTILLLPTLIERWWSWSEARLDRIYADAQLAQIEVNA